MTLDPIGAEPSAHASLTHSACLAGTSEATSEAAAHSPWAADRRLGWGREADREPGRALPPWDRRPPHGEGRGSVVVALSDDEPRPLKHPSDTHLGPLGKQVRLAFDPVQQIGDLISARRRGEHTAHYRTTCCAAEILVVLVGVIGYPAADLDVPGIGAVVTGLRQTMQTSHAGLQLYCNKHSLSPFPQS
jgi:hypothetical protein